MPSFTPGSWWYGNYWGSGVSQTDPGPEPTTSAPETQTTSQTGHANSGTGATLTVEILENAARVASENFGAPAIYRRYGEPATACGLDCPMCYPELYSNADGLCSRDAVEMGITIPIADMMISHTGPRQPASVGPRNIIPIGSNHISTVMVYGQDLSWREVPQFIDNREFIDHRTVMIDIIRSFA